MKPVVKEIYLTNENTNEDGHPVEAAQLKPITTIGSDTVNVENESAAAIVFVNGTKRGRVKLNDKGNMSVESESKHVNIEAKESIQIKPTKNITFDSSRRMDSGKGNEVHLQFLDDDHDPDNPEHGHDQEEYASVKYEGRSHDIRCFEHGGIALQPCGKDGDNFENKVKFESSRKNDIEDDGSYGNEGGKGLEFGTFNNLHTSLYNRDYRFKCNAPLMAVTRGTITTYDKDGNVTSDPTKIVKWDYPTQADDFKDIPLSYSISGEEVNVSDCSWDDSTNSWKTASGYTKLEASLAELVFIVNVIKSGAASDFGELKNLLQSLNDKINPSEN